MSHFTVMVIGDDVESQLAPYQENNMGDCPEDYLEFDDRTEEVQEGWDALSEAKRAEYDGMADYAEDYHGYSAHEIDGEQRFGYWRNPNTNAKWDWYQIGGRWSGMLLLKPGAQGSYGERSGTNEDKADDMSRCDQARKGDIDIDGMRDEAGEKAGRKWDVINPVIAPHASTFVSWETCVERSKNDNGGVDYERARDLYHGQPLRVALAAAANDTSNPHHEMFFWLHDIEDYLLPREEHVHRARDGVISTFAYLDSTRDPAWVERGQMGWFAFVRDEKDKAAWDREFNAYFDSLPDDTLITIVDCRITLITIVDCRI